MATRVFSRNAYFKQQLSALLSNTSPVVKFICVVTTVGYLLSYSETAVRALSVTPGYLLPPSFWIWTAFTFCFLEMHFWEVLVDIVTVGLCGKLIEPLWGQMEMMTFFAITNLGVAVLTSFYYLFVYMCTKNTEILFDVHIHGLAGYVAAVSVAVRQIMPDHLIARTRFGEFTNRNVPLTVFFASLILWLVNLLDGTFASMFASGLIVSWVYLRFYQRHSNNQRGDSADNFTFASFFPYMMQPVISILVNPLYLLFLRIGLIRPPPPPRSTSSSLTSVSVTMPGVDPHDMERRRQIALKALSERLSKTTDSSRQNTLPKSFPQQTAKHQHHGHSHHGHHSHSHHHHHGQPINLGPYMPPAIPLPAPPPPAQQQSTASSSGIKQTEVQSPLVAGSSFNLIDIENASTSSDKQPLLPQDSP